MPEAGAVLKFPGGKPPKKPESIKPPPSLPSMDSYEYEETVELHQIAISVKRRGEEIVSLIDEDRDAARKAGIEVLGLQIRAILEGEKFSRVMDALEDATFRRVAVQLTREGIDKVHRLERLVSDADTIVIQRMSGRKKELGRSIGDLPQRTQLDSGFWVPLVIVGIAGVLGVLGVVAIMTITNARQNNQLGQVVPPVQVTKPGKLLNYSSRSRKSKKMGQSR